MSWWALAGGLGAVAGVVVTLVWHFFHLIQEFIAAKNLSLAQGSYVPIFAFTGVLVLMIFARRVHLRSDAFARYLFDVHYRQGNRRESHTLTNGFVSFAAPICGAVVGLEGIVIEWTSMIASKLGDLFRVARKHHRGLIACALGAGISAQMGNPFLGIVFVLEVIFAWSFPASYFGPLAIAAFAATGVSQGLLSSGYFRGAVPGFDAGFSFFLSDGNFFMSLSNLLFVVPGITFVSVIAVWLILWLVQETESVSTRIGSLLGWPMEQGEAVVRLGLWFIASAVVLYSFPPVLSLGRDLLIPSFWQSSTMFVLVGVLGVRLLLLALSIVAFRSIGIILPVIFFGASLGYFVSSVTGAFGISGDVGHALALLTAGAIFSGAFAAPATACVLVYFLAGDIVPERGSFLLAATMINFFVHNLVGLLAEDRLPTLGLHRLGLRFRDGLCFNTRSPITVRDAMLSWVQPISKDASLGAAYSTLLKSRFTSLPITDRQKKLVGMLSLSDFQDLEAWRAMEHDSQVAELMGIEDIMQPIRSRVASNMQLDQALQMMRDEDIVPVTEPESETLIGLLQRSDLENVYNKDVLKRLVAHERQL